MQEGPPRTTAHQTRARQGVSRGRGPPDMGADHASHGAGVSTRGGAHLRVQLINMKVLRCEQWGGFQRIAWAMSRLSTTILELAPSPAKNPNLQRAPSNRKGAPSGKALERSGRIGIGKHQRKPIKQKKGRLDADPTN